MRLKLAFLYSAAFEKARLLDAITAAKECGDDVGATRLRRIRLAINIMARNLEMSE